MTTRIETKQEATERLSTLQIGELFTYLGDGEAHMLCHKGTTYNIFCFESLRTMVKEDCEVIPVTRTDLLPGEWRVKERGPTAVLLEDIDPGAHYRLPDKADVYEKGLMQLGGHDYDGWNRSVVETVHTHSCRLQVFLLQWDRTDKDMTHVFTEL